MAAALGCAAVALLLFPFFGPASRGYVDTGSMFWWWISQWIDPGAETEHGWLIAAVSVWLFWRNLKRESGRGVRLAEARSGDTLAPLGAMLSGLALHAIGFVAQQTRISIVAFLIFTWGVLRLAGGRAWGRAAVFPLGFLVFEIPVNVID